MTEAATGLNAAISQQSHLVDALRGKYSVAICNENRAAYVAIEKRIARAGCELANEAETLFFRKLQDAGCTSIHFQPIRVSAVGFLSDGQSIASFHAKEVATYCPEALA